MPLDTLLRRHARYRPTHLATVVGEHRLTFAQLDRRVNRMANALRALGVRKGDAVGAFMGNRLELLELYHVAAKTGAVVVPLSPLLRGDGLGGLLADARCVALVTTRELVPEVERGGAERTVGHVLVVGADGRGHVALDELLAAADDAEPPREGIRPDDPYNIVYSSGTTGLPKGIIHSQRVRAAYGTTFATSFRIHPESVILHAGSLVFNGAFLTLMPSFHLGCTYVLMPAFDPRAVIDALTAEHVTHMLAVPSQLSALLEHDDFDARSLPRLECLVSLGAPLLGETKAELVERLPDRIYELYGLTEGAITVLDRDDFGRKSDSVGVPPPLFELEVQGDDGAPTATGTIGEIVGRGPITMSGYHGRPDLTEETLRDGWIRTGDLGYVDEDGFLHLVDRKKDMLITGGVNVFPRDIEEVLGRHPDVAEVAVFGAPDERWGETPVAAVRLAPGARTTPEALREWVNARVPARYQKVSDVVVRARLPMNVAGKVLRRELRDEYIA